MIVRISNELGLEIIDYGIAIKRASKHISPGQKTHRYAVEIIFSSTILPTFLYTLSYPHGQGTIGKYSCLDQGGPRFHLT